MSKKDKQRRPMSKKDQQRLSMGKKDHPTKFVGVRQQRGPQGTRFTNQSLYSMFTLLHGSSTETRGKQCVCRMRSKNNLYVYTSFFELVLNFGILHS